MEEEGSRPGEGGMSSPLGVRMRMPCEAERRTETRARRMDD